MMYKTIDILKIDKNNIIFNGNTLNSDFLEKFSNLKSRFIALKNTYQSLQWIHANPSNSEVVSKSKEKYIPTNDRKKFIEDLNKYIVDNNVKLIFIEGKRGSGKTFMQNYFLNTQIKNIKRTTWFRVDVTKIYDYNIKNHAKPIDFKTYLLAQIVFVFFRYRKSHTDKKDGVTYGVDPVFSKINDDFFIGTNMNDKEKEAFIRAIEQAPHGNTINGKPLFHKYTTIIAQNILKSINKHENQIVLFIDGIDNVSLADKRYIKCKTFINKAIVSYLEGEDSCLKQFKKIIFSSRKELDVSYSLIQELKRQNYYNENIKKSILIEPLELNNIFFEHFVQYSNKNGYLLPDSIKDDFICIIDTIINYFRNRYKSSDGFSFVKNIFDGDTREAFFSVISIYFFLKNYLFNKSTKANDISDFCNNKKNIQDWNKSEFKSVIIEALFKNGCYYTPDYKQIKYIPPYRSLGFTNIFNPAFYLRLDHSPLVTLYLLKYLKKITKINLDELKKRCSKFNICEKPYSSYNAIKILIEFNYLELNEDIVSITDKGRITYDTTLNNIDVFAANIYNALTDDNLSIEVYETDGRKYIYTILKNTIVYVTYLNKLQKKHIESLEDKNKKEFIDNFKIDFIESLSPSFRKTFFNSNYNEIDFINKLQTQEIITFKEFLLLPDNYEICNKKIIELFSTKRKLYKKVSDFFDKDLYIPDTLKSILYSNKVITIDEIKVLLLFRIFEKNSKNKREVVKEDFIFEFEDSAWLKKFISLDIEEVVRIINHYTFFSGNNFELFEFVYNVLSKFCKFIS